MVLRTKLARLDALISWSLDRVLPKNLSARYLLGLGLVAVLAISGQIVIQLSLTRQIEMQDQIRTLDARLPVTDTLRRHALVLQLSSSLGEMQKQAITIRELAERLSFTVPEAVFPPARDESLLQACKEVIRVASELNAVLATLPVPPGSAPGEEARPRITALVDRLIAAATVAEEQLKSNTAYLEVAHRSQVWRFKNVEALLTLITLLVLVLEALYVFRPAVARLYDALRIRSEFLSRMSHEIRNPMNSIIGMANLLDETPINEQQKRYVSILRKSSRGLLDMLNSLLDFSSLESGKLKLESIPFDLYEVLDRSIDMAVVGAHANGIELVLDLDEQTPLKLVGDPLRLFQVLVNLLSNAVKFTKRGQVTLQVQSRLEAGAPAVTFRVIDTGVGIDPDKLEAIFDPFVQEDSSVKRRFGGTGLGLSIARQLVERMGGKLWAESQKDVGSKFAFTLSFPSREPSSVADFAAAHPVPTFKATVFEGNPVIAAVVQRLVATAGGEYMVLEDKSQLLSALLRSERDHVLIVDYESVKDQLNEYLPTLAKRDLETLHLIMLLKTTALPADLETLGHVGIKNLLFKPVRPVQFFEALSASLNPQARKLPAMSGSVASTAVSESRGPVAERPLSILVVDDSQDNQMLVGLYLQSSPHKLIYADNGQVALQKFKEGRFDLVLMDLQMPEMDGYSATEAIRKWERSLKIKPVPVIAISAHDINHDPVRFRAAGFTSHLVKPIDAHLLRERVLQYSARDTQVESISKEANMAAMSQENEHKEDERPVETVDETVAEIEKQIRKLAPAYLENRRKEVVELRRMFESQELKSIQNIGHRLKGNGKSYGFARLSEIGAELEIAARDQDVPRVGELIGQLSEFVASAQA